MRHSLLGGWLLLAPAVLAAPPLPPAANPLELRVSRWALPFRPVIVTVEQSGVLEGRHLAVYLFLDQNQVARVATSSNETLTRIPVAALTPGRHLLSARAGREVAQAELRVLPWSWIVTAAALLLGWVGLGVASVLRYRRRREDPRRRHPA